jgi:hypothetical protein
MESTAPAKRLSFKSVTYWVGMRQAGDRLEDCACTGKKKCEHEKLRSLHFLQKKKLSRTFVSN